MPNYSKFKTPFFEVYVGDSRGKEMIKLPHHLVRLLEKLEIQEVLDSSEEKSIKRNLVTMTFVEGSREPASQDPNAKIGALYPLDAEIAGTLTNRTGILTDLVFSGGGKIGFFTKAEQTSGKNSVKTRRESKTITAKRAKQAAARPRFLFQEHNRIKVTWGYLEDPFSRRTIITNIKIIQTEFLDSASTITIITAEGPLSTWDQIAPAKGVSFYKKTKIKKNEEFDDLPIKDFVKSFCSTMGLDCVVSDKFPVEKSDKGKVKQIPGGMSFKQFFDRLAKQYNAYWNVIINPTTGKETLYFVEKSEVEKSLIHSEEEAALFNYKNPQSIVRSIKVKVDFGGVTENQATNQKAEKDPKKTTKVPGFAPQGKNQNPVNNSSPTTSGENAKKVLGEGNTTGKAGVSPVENNKDALEKQSKMREEDARRRLVALTLETIGYAKIIPGMVKLSGIGVRYSGKYRIISVKHVIDSSGYFTTAECTSQFLGAGGVEPVAKAQKAPAKTSVVGFEDKTKNKKPSAEQQRQSAMGIKSIGTGLVKTSDKLTI